MPIPPFRPLSRATARSLETGVARAAFVSLLGASLAVAGCHRAADSTLANVAAEDDSPTMAITRSAQKASEAAATQVARALYAVESQIKVLPVVAVAAPMQLSFGNLPAPPSIDTLTTPATHQAGVVVFEPVAATGVEAPSADLAAGCGYYLEFLVAGQPEFGQSPWLTSINRVRRERKLSNLRLNDADALSFSHAVGATVAWVGTVAPIAGATDGSLELTYRLVDVATGKAVGEPLTTRGTQSALVAALPSLATQMAQRAGATKPQIMLSPAATPEEIAAESRVIRADHPADADVKLVTAAAPTDPVAMLYVLAVEQSQSATKFTDDATTLLTKLAPNNPLAWGFTAKLNDIPVAQLRTQLAALRKAYPQNYALAHTDVFVQRVAGNPRAELAAGEDAVRDAPANPDAWMSLGWTLGEMGDALRRCRVSMAITADEWDYLHKIYEVWEHCEQSATTLDPVHEAAWDRLAEAATFASDRAVADDAYAKAETCSYDKSNVFGWGLQMYQSKWGGSPSDLQAVADHAAKADYPRIEQVGSVVADLRDEHFDAQADALTARYLAPLDARLQKDPNDADAHWQKASLLWHENKMPKSCHEYKAVASLRPNDVEAHFDYASALDKLGAQGLAIPEYETVLKLDPKNTFAPVDMGIDMKHIGQLTDAEKWLRLGLQRYPNSMEGHYGLGELNLREKHYLDAAGEFHRALTLGANSPMTYADLTSSLAAAGHYPESIHWGEEGLSLFAPNEDSETGEYREQISNLHASLAYAYLKDKQFSDAETQNDAATALNPGNSMAIINQGYVYNGTKRRGKARQTWQAAAAMNLDPDNADEVRHDLATFPENGT